MDDQQAKLKKKLKILIALVIALIVFWVAVEIIQSSKFHLVSTTPSTNNISTVTPSISLNFNRTLSTTGLLVSINPYDSFTTTIKNKSLSINLSIPLNQNDKYLIIVHSIEDVSDSKLTNVEMSFKPQFVNYNSLPNSTQKSILHQQSQAASNQPPSFSGTDDLVNAGLSTQQVQDFETGVTNFATANKIKNYSVNVVGSSVTPGPNNGSGIFTVNFTFQINSTSYNGSLTYSGLETAQLTITNTQGSVLYQYGSVSSSGSSTTGSTTQ